MPAGVILINGMKTGFELRLSDSRAPALTHHALLPVIHPLASSVIWAGGLVVESMGQDKDIF